jgi:hypothetical protein
VKAYEYYGFTTEAQVHFQSKYDSIYDDGHPKNVSELISLFKELVECLAQTVELSYSLEYSKNDKTSEPKFSSVKFIVLFLKIDQLDKLAGEDRFTRSILDLPQVYIYIYMIIYLSFYFV